MDRVTEITKDCFNALTQIRNIDARSQPMPEILHQRMRTFVDRAMRRAGELGFDAQDAQEIGYALVALIDEAVLGASMELRDFWLQRMLQLHYFHTNVAGEEFFSRLQALRADPGRAEILRVYYLCLLFDFRGRYRVRGREAELAQIIEEVGHDLSRFGQMRTPPLAPHAARPNESVGSAKRHMPLVWVSAVAVILSIVLYTGLRIGLDAQADELIQKIDVLARGS